MNSGIAWPADKEKYGRTAWLDGPADGQGYKDDTEKNDYIRKTLVPPQQWREAWPEKYGNGYNSTNLPDLKTWEGFQIWMRTAGLYTFSKPLLLLVLL